jgi:thiol-disulfide isomerase/thioredoxin
MKNNLRWLHVIAIVLLFSTYGPVSHAVQPPRGIIQLDGREAPPLKLQDMDGDTYELAQSPGHWVFVHFWASWCGPCRREIPTIQKMKQAMDDTSLEIVLINTAETDDTVFSFLGIVAPELMSPLMDYDGLVTQRWQPRGLPSTFFVDPQGRLQYLALGGRPWDEPDYLRFLRQLVSDDSDEKSNKK